jgi:hypothetical protein
VSEVLYWILHSLKECRARGFEWADGLSDLNQAATYLRVVAWDTVEIDVSATTLELDEPS